MKAGQHVKFEMLDCCIAGEGTGTIEIIEYEDDSTRLNRLRLTDVTITFTRADQFDMEPLADTKGYTRMKKYTFLVVTQIDVVEVVGTHYTVNEDKIIHVFDGEEFVASFFSMNVVGIRRDEAVDENNAAPTSD